MKKKQILTVVATGLLTLWLPMQPVMAATKTAKPAPAPVITSANGYLVRPASNPLDVSPGTKKTVKLFIQNVSKGTENIQAIVNDFEASADESGTPVLLLNGESAPKHGLKQYMTLTPSTFILQPGDQKEVDVTIAIPPNAAGGGYFGVVRFAPAGAGKNDTNVTLAASVGALFLVRVPGDIKELLTIASFDVRKGDHPRVVFMNGHDLTALVRFQNSGNVQVAPYGKITLKQGSKTLQATEINKSDTDTPSQVLPDSIRRYSVPLTQVKSFGKYTVEGSFGYGSNGQLLTASTTFYIVPAPVLIVAGVVLALILFAIFGLPRLIRAYNRRIIQRATRRR